MDSTNRKKLLDKIKTIRKETNFDDTLLEKIIFECTTKQSSFGRHDTKCKICNQENIKNKKKHIDSEYHKSSNFFLTILIFTFFCRINFSYRTRIQ